MVRGQRKHIREVKEKGNKELEDKYKINKENAEKKKSGLRQKATNMGDCIGKGATIGDNNYEEV